MTAEGHTTVWGTPRQLGVIIDGAFGKAARITAMAMMADHAAAHCELCRQSERAGDAISVLNSHTSPGFLFELVGKDLILRVSR